jgi:hypothetical protein
MNVLRVTQLVVMPVAVHISKRYAKMMEPSHHPRSVSPCGAAMHLMCQKVAQGFLDQWHLGKILFILVIRVTLLTPPWKAVMNSRGIVKRMASFLLYLQMIPASPYRLALHRQWVMPSSWNMLACPLHLETLASFTQMASSIVAILAILQLVL